MIDRNLVTSGFDTETLISEHYLSYILLAQIEAGRFPLQFAVENPNQGLDLTIVLHPPEDYERLYTPEPSAPLPECVPGSFAIELLGDDEDAFLHLSIVVTVIDNATNQEVASIAFGSFIGLELEADETDDGFERNHALRLSLVRFDDTTRAALEAAGADPDATEEEVRAQLDRTVPLGVASNQQVQQVRLRKFVDGGHRSVGSGAPLGTGAGRVAPAARRRRGRAGLPAVRKPPRLRHLARSLSAAGPGRPFPPGGGNRAGQW